MGCGASKVGPLKGEREKPQHPNRTPNNHETKTTGHVGSLDNAKSNGHLKSKIKPSDRETSLLNGDVYPKEDEEGTKECSERQPEAMSNHSSSPSEYTSSNITTRFSNLLSQYQNLHLVSFPWF